MFAANECFDCLTSILRAETCKNSESIKLSRFCELKLLADSR